MQNIQLKDLLEAGCHFGHEVKRWNPKANTFIYTARNKIHIIDLIKTKAALIKACEFAQKLGEENKRLLFVGTKRQARDIIRSEAERVNCPFFSQRWVGGFLTNWSEIKKNLDKLNKMEEEKAKGDWQVFPKHEQVKLDRERLLLEKFYRGVKMLNEPPDALFIVDIKKESMVVKEGQKKLTPIIAIVDTNSDPAQVDYPIPANDDAVKSVSLIVRFIASAYEEGQSIRKNANAQPAAKETLTSETTPEKTDKTSAVKVVKKAEKEEKPADKKAIKVKRERKKKQ